MSMVSLEFVRLLAPVAGGAGDNPADLLKGHAPPGGPALPVRQSRLPFRVVQAPLHRWVISLKLNFWFSKQGTRKIWCVAKQIK